MAHAVLLPSGGTPWTRTEFSGFLVNSVSCEISPFALSRDVSGWYLRAPFLCSQPGQFAKRFCSHSLQCRMASDTTRGAHSSQVGGTRRSVLIALSSSGGATHQLVEDDTSW